MSEQVGPPMDAIGMIAQVAAEQRVPLPAKDRLTSYRTPDGSLKYIKLVRESFAPRREEAGRAMQPNRFTGGEEETQIPGPERFHNTPEIEVFSSEMLGAASKGNLR